MTSNDPCDRGRGTDAPRPCDPIQCVCERSCFRFADRILRPLNILLYLRNEHSLYVECIRSNFLILLSIGRPADASIRGQSRSRGLQRDFVVVIGSEGILLPISCSRELLIHDRGVFHLGQLVVRRRWDGLTGWIELNIGIERNTRGIRITIAPLPFSSSCRTHV